MRFFLQTCCALAMLNVAAAAGVRPAPPHARELAYRFDVATPGRVHVTLDLRLPADGTEIITLPSEWAETTGLERGVRGLCVSGGGARLESMPRSSMRLLRGTPGSAVQLEYDLVGEADGGAGGMAERHRVLLGPELREFNGNNGLVAPEMAPELPVHVRLRVTGLPAGQTVVTSFGTGETEQMTGRWGEVQNALFVSGALRTRQLTVDGAPVLLALAGEWRFTDDEAAGKVERILGEERLFWRDLAIPWYAVVIAPLGGAASGDVGGGGTAFTHAFTLSLAPREEFGAETESLLAHEAFHAWNPVGMGRVGATAMPAWFTEGVTTFYGDRLLERARLLNEDEYLHRLNRIVRDDRLLRAAQGGAAEGAARHGGGVTRLDAEATSYQAPYLQGALAALWLDGEIRRQTKGARSLDDLMLALRADKGEPLTEERVLRTARYFVDPATTERMRAMVDGAGVVPLDAVGLAASLGGCVTVRDRTLWSYDLGLDRADLRHGGVLRSVREGSAAWQAGLRNGQTVEGWEMWTGDPDREVVVMVHTAGQRQTVRYLPRGAAILAPQVERVEGCVVAGKAPGE